MLRSPAFVAPSLLRSVAQEKPLGLVQAATTALRSDAFTRPSLAASPTKSRISTYWPEVAVTRLPRLILYVRAFSIAGLKLSTNVLPATLYDAVEEPEYPAYVPGAGQVFSSMVTP